jgi:hypothetical protein
MLGRISPNRKPNANARAFVIGYNEHPAKQQAHPRFTARYDDTIKKQNNFRAFPEHRQADDGGKGHQGSRPTHDIAPEPADILAHLAAVTRHPYIVPGKHDHRETENGRIKDFLARTCERAGQSARE